MAQYFSFVGHRAIHSNPVCPGVLHAVFQRVRHSDAKAQQLLKAGYKRCKRCGQKNDPRFTGPF